MFIFISSSVGNIGFFVIIFPFSCLPHTQYGKSGGHVHTPSAFIKAFFTALSSNEWNVIIHNLPFLFKQSIESVTVLYNGSISLLTSILIAWNVLLAGCPCDFLDFGTLFSIICTSLDVVSIGYIFLYSQIFLAILLENFSSPYS